MPSLSNVSGRLLPSLGVLANVGQALTRQSCGRGCARVAVDGGVDEGSDSIALTSLKPLLTFIDTLLAFALVDKNA